MSIRVTFLWIYVLYFSHYAWKKSWFISACAGIFLMAFAFHPDVPRSMFGITGFSCLNVLLFNVTLAWWTQRRQQGISWDAPRDINIKLILYLGVLGLSTLRLLANLKGYHDGIPNDEFERESFLGMFNEYVLDSIRYLLPAIFIYEGCRTRRDATIALACILAMYFFIAVQVVKYMPLSALTMSGAQLSRTSFKILKGTLGYSRVTVSMVLSGASWAMLCALPLIRPFKYKLIIMGAAGLIAFGQALTGGRMGYLTFGVLGLIVGIVKWRRMLFILLLAGIAVPTFVPSARDRLLKGLIDTGPNSDLNEREISAGRSEAWPAVIDSIKERPVLGYGRQGMITSGTHYWLSINIFGAPDFTHPHQAYLQLLQDVGIIGFALVLLIFLALVKKAFSLLRDNSDPLFSPIGGAALLLILALLVAGFSGQTFYPEHQSVGMWAMAALMLRVWVEREKRPSTTSQIFEDPEVELDVVDSAPTVESEYVSGYYSMPNGLPDRPARTQRSSATLTDQELI